MYRTTDTSPVVRRLAAFGTLIGRPLDAAPTRSGVRDSVVEELGMGLRGVEYGVGSSLQPSYGVSDKRHMLRSEALTGIVPVARRQPAPEHRFWSTQLGGQPVPDRRLGAQCDALMPVVMARWMRAELVCLRSYIIGPCQERLSSDVAGERQLVAGSGAPWSACCPLYPPGNQIGPELRSPIRSSIGRPVNEQQDFLAGVEGDFSRP
jgi:hypothetical protein